MPETAQAQASATPDAVAFTEVEIYGRGVTRRTAQVFEMMAGEIADCTQELLTIAGVYYANKARVTALLRDSEGQPDGKPSVEQILAAVDVRTLTAYTSNALFYVLSKASSESLETLRSLHPSALLLVAAAFLRENTPFLSSLPALFGATTEASPLAEADEVAVGLSD